MISESDVVCSVPIGFDNPEMLQYLSDNYIFDYAHVGETIKLSRCGNKPKTQVDELLVKEDDDAKDRKNPTSPLKPEEENLNEQALIEDKKDRFIPHCIKDHFVHRYLLALQRARPYFLTPEKSANGSNKMTK